MKRILVLLLTLGIFDALAMAADTTSVASPKIYEAQKTFYPKGGEVEFFMGLDFRYRDIVLDRPYSVLVNLTPGIKYRPWAHTLITAQALIPVFNQYGDYYKRPRLNVLTVSQEILLFKKLAIKPTVGLFTQERWGIDLKLMCPVTPWLAFEAQAGYTGYLSMAEGWLMSPPSKILALGGADFYIPKWNTQFRLVGGRYLYEDYGACFEGARHFKHVTLSAYVQYSTRMKTHFAKGFNGGFCITVALPPYRRRHKTVSVRPASGFEFSYNMNADAQSNMVYRTDPEEDIRHGWFSPDILPWGVNLIYDYTDKSDEPRKARSNRKEGRK